MHKVATIRKYYLYFSQISVLTTFFQECDLMWFVLNGFAKSPVPVIKFIDIYNFM